MTIAQNVAFPLRQHTRKSPDGDPRRSCWPGWPRWGCRRTSVDKKPAELSGGMRKRVGLARALALEPEIMLYDEPTTGLDPIMSDVINELILSTRRQHPVTSIVVTHDMRTAQKVADRVVMLYPLARLEADEPQILYDGPPERDRAGRRQPRVAVRPRRGRRAADGNAAAEREVSHGRTGDAISRGRDVSGHAADRRHPAGDVRQAAHADRPHLSVQVRFDYAGGVTKDTPVRKSGILIGRVSDVQLTDHDEKVLVTAEIQSDKTIYQNEECYITRDLLGDTALAFIPNPGKPGAGEPIEPGTILDGKVSDDPTGLKRALQRPDRHREDTGKALTAASKQLGEAAHRVEDILDAETQKNVQSVLSDAAASLADHPRHARRRREPGEAQPRP